MIRRAATTTPPPFANRPRLLVAGLVDGVLATRAAALKARLNDIFPPTQSLQIDYVGGADGVTAANQFEANVAPDGETALMVSGAAALAWLIGDPRAQFDVGHWLPISTAQVSGLVITTNPAHLKMGDLRLAIEAPTSTALAAQLGLYLLATPAKSVTTVPDAVQAIASGSADVAFLLGRQTAHRGRDAISRGMTPLFSLGSLDTANSLVADPSLPSAPTLPEALVARGVTADQSLVAAWQSVAAATRLDTALLLPWLTPANVVAWWRTALAEIGTEGLAPDIDGVVWHTDPTGNFGLNPIITATDTSLALHRWLTNRAG